MIAWNEIDFRRTPLTLSLAAVVAALEIVSTFDAGRRDFFFRQSQLSIGIELWNGAVWQPLTTTLLHGDLLHAAFNLYWLMAFGHVLERRWGSFRFGLLFLWLAYVCSMASFLIGNVAWRPGTPVHTGIGLSGVGYGLFALLWVAGRWRPELRAFCSRDVVALFAGWFLLCIVLTASGAMAVDNYGHGAGLVFGALLATALYAPKLRRLWQAAAALATLLVLALMFAAPSHPLYDAARRIHRLRQLLDRPAAAQLMQPPRANLAPGGLPSSREVNSWTRSW